VTYLAIFRPADEQREQAGLPRPCVCASGVPPWLRILPAHCTRARPPKEKWSPIPRETWQTVDLFHAAMPTIN